MSNFNLPFPYVIDHIPMNSNKRSKYKMDWEYITIHNTGNSKSTARNERNYLTNPSNKSSTGYHIVIDEIQAIECIPLTENAWHAGDGGSGAGNRRSIGIEICESGNYQKTLENAVLLVAELLKSKNKNVESLRQHWNWSGKNCPRLIRAGHLGWTWDKFKNEVQKELLKGKVIEEMSKYFKDLPKDHWGAKSADRLYEKKILSGKGDGILDPNSSITRIECVALIDGAIEYLLKELKK
jgi:N-acetylmuramoyl-L-alanine amidase